MKLEYLRYFISVAEYLNFTKAAQENHIAQTAISRYIAAIENELGVRLFERNNRNVSLTPEGIQFYFDISSVLKKYDQAVKNTQAIKSGYYGHINIGIGAYEDDFISIILKKFHTQYPNFKATVEQFSYAELQQMIVKGDLDIVFMNSFFCDTRIDSDVDSIKVCDLFHVDACAIFNKDDILAQKDNITKRDINNQSVLLYNDVNNNSISRLATLNIHPRNTIQFNSLSGLISMIKANYGIGFVPSFIESKLPSDVVMVPQTIFPSIKYFAIISTLNHNPATDYFMNIVRLSNNFWKRFESKNHNKG